MKCIKQARKVLSILCCTALLTATFAGCGSSKAVSSSEKATATSGAASTSDASEVSGNLTVWEHNYSFETAVKAIVKGF